MHVPATQITSMAAGAVFGKERATDANASSHRLAGTPTHEIAGDAGGPLSAGAPQAAITRAARMARRRRSVVSATDDKHFAREPGQSLDPTGGRIERHEVLYPDAHRSVQVDTRFHGEDGRAGQRILAGVLAE